MVIVFRIHDDPENLAGFMGILLAMHFSLFLSHAGIDITFEWFHMLQVCTFNMIHGKHM